MKQNFSLYWKSIGPARYRYREIIQFAGNNIFMDRKPSTEYEQKLDAHAMKLIKISISTTIFVAFSFSLILIGPIYVFVSNGEYANPTGVIMPFVNPDSGRGFAINLSIQFAVASIASVGLISTEILSCMINNTYAVMTDMVCFNMSEFSDGLLQPAFSEQSKMALRNIIVQLQDLEAYLNAVKRIYYWKFFLQPPLTTGCVALGIFSQMIVSYCCALR